MVGGHSEAAYQQQVMGGGALIPGYAAGLVKVPIFIGGIDRGVSGSTTTGPQWDDPGTSVGGQHPPPSPKTIQYILSKGSRVVRIPSGGMMGVGIDDHHPPNSLHETPHAGHDSYYGGR